MPGIVPALGIVLLPLLGIRAPFCCTRSSSSRLSCSALLSAGEGWWRDAIFMVLPCLAACFLCLVPVSSIEVPEVAF